MLQMCDFILILQSDGSSVAFLVIFYAKESAGADLLTASFFMRCYLQHMQQKSQLINPSEMDLEIKFLTCVLIYKKDLKNLRTIFLNLWVEEKNSHGPWRK